MKKIKLMFTGFVDFFGQIIFTNENKLGWWWRRIWLSRLSSRTSPVSVRIGWSAFGLRVQHLTRLKTPKNLRNSFMPTDLLSMIHKTSELIRSGLWFSGQWTSSPIRNDQDSSLLVGLTKNFIALYEIQISNLMKARIHSCEDKTVEWSRPI